jgi:hypothetical protein
MKYKAQPEGFWVKAKEDVNDGDIITILDSGQIVEGEFGERYVFSISTKNGERNMSFNKTTMNNLSKAFGDETETWKKQLAKVYVDKANIGGVRKTVLYLSALDWDMDEETGKFYKKRGDKADEEMPFEPTNEREAEIVEEGL